jgi:TolB-like protein/Tfp pilus assembly protein PilF
MTTDPRFVHQRKKYNERSRKVLREYRKVSEKVGKRGAGEMLWETKTSYEFGPFCLDASERQLLRGGELVPLRPKVFDILLVLVQRSGRILTKDEVMKLVWPNTVVEEGNIGRNISTLRNALGERPGEQRYIETIPWRGYRFVAKVREVHHDETIPSIESIAILPLVNVNGDPQSEYLSDGITDSLITSLAQSTNIRITSRNSAFRYKGREIDVQSVGRELKVQAVVMGRVTESEDLRSIGVELVDTRDDRHIWGAQYVRKVGDLFIAQEEIANEIADKLRLQLSGPEPQLLKRRHTQNNDAYILYLQGRYHFNKLTPDGVQRGVDFLQRAIEKDPNYALAYAALGDCHNYLGQRDEAKRAVIRALELNETLGEAHGSLGFFRFLYDWDFAGAEREFKRALSLSPNYAEAHHWYAIYLANMARHDEADAEARRAVELDPLSLLINMTPALNFYVAREYDQALEQLQKVLEMEPNFLAARSVRGGVLAQKGMYKEAIVEYEKVLELLKGAGTAEASVKALIARVYAKCGKKSEAMKLLEEVTAQGSALAYLVAGIYVALGNADAAFEWLDKAFEQHDVQFVSLKVDPLLDGIRSDSRFQELLHRVGLPA